MKNIITALLTTTLVLMTSVVFSQGACENETSLTYNFETYNLIEIGDQCWLDRPINTLTYTNGDSIPQFDWDENNDLWATTNEGAVAADAAGNLLYNWYAINQGVCPSGYHVPDELEWRSLELSLGVSRSEVKNLGYHGANFNVKQAWQDNGFDLVFSGIAVGGDASYRDYENSMYMWSRDDVEGGNAYDRTLYQSNNLIAKHDNTWATGGNKRNGMLAMCVKDNSISGISGNISFFVEPGPQTIQNEDFDNINAGDTLYLASDTTLNTTVLKGTLISDSLVVSNRGVVVNLDDFQEDILTEIGGPKNTYICLSWGFSTNGLDCDYVYVLSNLEYCEACQSRGLSCGVSPGDWKNCGGNIADITYVGDGSKRISEATYTTPKGRTYSLERPIKKVYFGDINVVKKDWIPKSASDWEGMQTYIDEDRTIPYSVQKTYKQSRLSDLSRPIPTDKFFWFDEGNRRFTFKIDQTTGILSQVTGQEEDDIIREDGITWIGCKCFDCCGGFPNPQSYVIGITDGPATCQNGCMNGWDSSTSGPVESLGLSSTGFPPGGCCSSPPPPPPISDFDYYVVPGDTTIYYNEIGFTQNVFDTVYKDVNLTQFVEFGRPFLNEYGDTLYANNRGVLLTSDMIDLDLIDRDYFDARPGVTCMCCECPGNGDCYMVAVESQRRRRGCAKICEDAGYSSSFNGNGQGQNPCSNWSIGPLPELDNTKERTIRNQYVWNTDFDFTDPNDPNFEWQGNIDNLEGKLLSPTLSEEFAPNNGRTVLNGGFDYLKNIVLGFEERHFSVGDDFILTEIFEDQLNRELPWDEVRKYRYSMCFCWSWAPECARTARSGPARRSCIRICKPFLYYNPCGDSFGIGGTGDQDGYKMFVQPGPTTLQNFDLGQTFNVGDTVYRDSQKTITFEAGFRLINDYDENLITNDLGVLILDINAEEGDRRPTFPVSAACTNTYPNGDCFIGEYVLQDGNSNTTPEDVCDAFSLPVTTIDDVSNCELEISLDDIPLFQDYLLASKLVRTNFKVRAEGVALDGTRIDVDTPNLDLYPKMSKVSNQEILAANHILYVDNLYFRFVQNQGEDFLRLEISPENNGQDLPTSWNDDALLTQLGGDATKGGFCWCYQQYGIPPDCECHRTLMATGKGAWTCAEACGSACTFNCCDGACPPQD